MTVEDSRKSENPREERKRIRALIRSFRSQLLPLNWGIAFFWSLLLSGLSVVNPYLSPLATNLQTHTLYASQAMQQGQIPYSDFFGTNGLLYYLLSYLGGLLPVNSLFFLLQFLVLFSAGIYFYKISAYFSRSTVTANSSSHWFYIFILALDFGGLYAGIFALPFMLTSFWFLIRYFEGVVWDEAFIWHGMDAALVFLIYPKALVLWLVAFPILFVYNVGHRHFARGFYQLLATVFGFLLVLYAVGYYAFETQILGLAIQQTFLYNLRLDFTTDHLPILAGIVFAFLLASGFLKGFVQTCLSLGQGRHTYSKIIALLGLLLQLVFMLGNADFQWSQLLLLVPYGFILSLSHLKADAAEEISYLKHHFFLPILLALTILVQPAYLYWLNKEVHQERVELARYLREQTKKSDKIYAWDNNASIYLESRRLSAARLITPEPYLNSESNQRKLLYDLRQNQARFVVVNHSIPLLESVQSNLEEAYQLVDLEMDYFTLYKKK